MVSGKHKSHSFRKIFVRTPGARTVVHRRLRKPGRATCPDTGVFLAGVPQVRKTKLMNMPKSKKRPQRAYGGVLSSSASRRRIIAKARSL
ncbi:MAG TPA: 50S ribosomal protein L34e [Acidobacteriota bacterium]|nr:50S ribosomal protein L34e [Acidobacteriota bacterium]